MECFATEIIFKLFIKGLARTQEVNLFSGTSFSFRWNESDFHIELEARFIILRKTKYFLLIMNHNFPLEIWMDQHENSSSNIFICSLERKMFSSPVDASV